MWRAGFGPMAEDIDQLKHYSQKSLFKAILKASASQPAYLDLADNMFKGLMMGIGEAGKMQKTKCARKNLDSTPLRGAGG